MFKEIQFEYIDLLYSHGTRCAGEVSGARDNGVCGVGVAYDSMVAGSVSNNTYTWFFYCWVLSFFY